MPKKDAGKIKDQAAKFLKKGKLDKALEQYQMLEKIAKNDFRIPQKVAEILIKMGDKEKGIEKYFEAAEKYHAKGFLVQAIAILKVVLDIDPDNDEARKKLAALTAERTGEGFTPIEDKEQPPPPEPEPEEPELEEPEPEQAETQAIEMEPLGEDSEDLEEVEPMELGDEVGEEAEIGLPLDDDDEAIGVGGEDEDEDEEEDEEEEEADLEDIGEEEAAEAIILPIEEEEELPESGPDRTPLFSDLSGGEFESVFELLNSSVVEPGEVIVQEGEEGQSIYIVARGKVRVYRVEEDGSETDLAEMGPNDFFGEIGYFHGERSASVAAVTKSQILEMAKEDMDTVIEEFPRIKDVLLKFYKERVMDNLLAKSPLFGHLTQDERISVMDSFEHREIPSGDIIVKEGDPGDSMFLIKSGEVVVRTVNPMSKELVELARLRGGDFFGEVSLVKNKPRTATVIAEVDSELMELSRDSFQDIAESHPEIHKAIEQTIEKRVEDTIHKMMSGLEE